MPQESVKKVPNPFVEAGPQPREGAQGPVEIQANLRLLQDSRDSLLITFADRNQRFQSFLVDIDRDRGMVALDELIPNTGERFLQNGEGVSRRSLPRRRAYRLGMRAPGAVRRTRRRPLLLGRPSRRSALPPAPQRLRASIKQSQPIAAEIAGEKLRAPLSGQPLDIPPPAPAALRRQCRRTPASRRDLRRLQRPAATGARSVARSNCVTCASTKSSTRPRRRPLQRDERPRPASGGSLRLPVSAARFEKTNCSEFHRTSPSAARRGRSSDGRRPRAPATGDAPSPVAGDARG